MGLLDRFLGCHGGGRGSHGGGHDQYRDSDDDRGNGPWPRDKDRRDDRDSGQGWGRGEPPRVVGIACPKCSAPNAANAHFRSQCGASVVPPKCAKYGGSLGAGARFCSGCGDPSA